MSDSNSTDSGAGSSHKLLICVICGWLYDEALGSPADGLPAGTRWVDVPEDWVCPDCGAGKSEFDMLELKRQHKQSN